MVNVSLGNNWYAQTVDSRTGKYSNILLSLTERLVLKSNVYYFTLFYFIINKIKKYFYSSQFLLSHYTPIIKMIKCSYINEYPI